MRGRPVFTEPGVTVLGNLAVDHIDGSLPSPGGCPSFAGAALARLGSGRIVTRCAPADRPLFDDVITGSGVPVDVLEANATSAFGMHYSGDDRVMTVDAVGPAWGRGEIAAARPRTEWVHVAPLLRSDFSTSALQELAERGHRVGYDGQGLVRAPRTGPLVTDADHDPALLECLQVLKLAGEEAGALVGGEFGEHEARELGVPEILVTHGSAGCELFVDGVRRMVPSAFTVEGVHATGAGDLFTVAYVAARARGDAPPDAAGAASQLVAELLLARRESLG